MFKERLQTACMSKCVASKSVRVGPRSRHKTSGTWRGSLVKRLTQDVKGLVSYGEPGVVADLPLRSCPPLRPELLREAADGRDEVRLAFCPLIGRRGRIRRRVRPGADSIDEGARQISARPYDRLHSPERLLPRPAHLGTPNHPENYTPWMRVHDIWSNFSLVV